MLTLSLARIYRQQITKNQKPLRQERNNIFAGIDWILVFYYLFLVGFGWLNIYAATRTEDDVAILSFSTKYGKQLIFICLAFPSSSRSFFSTPNFMSGFRAFYTSSHSYCFLDSFLLGKPLMEQPLGMTLERWDSSLQNL